MESNTNCTMMHRSQNFLSLIVIAISTCKVIEAACEDVYKAPIVCLLFQFFPTPNDDEVVVDDMALRNDKASTMLE